jgi:hypothetical protein
MPVNAAKLSADFLNSSRARRLLPVAESVSGQVTVTRPHLEAEKEASTWCRKPGRERQEKRAAEQLGLMGWVGAVEGEAGEV